MGATYFEFSVFNNPEITYECLLSKLVEIAFESDELNEFTYVMKKGNIKIGTKIFKNKNQTTVDFATFRVPLSNEFSVIERDIHTIINEMIKLGFSVKNLQSKQVYSDLNYSYESLIYSYNVKRSRYLIVKSIQENLDK